MSATKAVRPARRRYGIHRHPVRKSIPFLAPAAILYGIFLLNPMIQSIWLSFNEWNGFRTSMPQFVGFQNYVRIFTADPVFWRSVLNSVIWVVMSLAIPMLLSFLLALGLNHQMAGRNLFRSVIYIPAVFASITVAAMWKWIYNPQYGIVNETLRAVGLDSWAQQWLGDPKIAFYSIFVASIWQGVGFNMVLFLAGLQQVPQELVEASKIDGANAWQRLKAVTLPALRPTLVVVIILTMINSLKVFDLVLGMTGGGPAQSSQVLALWSYQQSFSNHNFGMGGAVATVLLIISLALVVPYLAWSLHDDKEN